MGQPGACGGRSNSPPPPGPCGHILPAAAQPAGAGSGRAVAPRRVGVSCGNQQLVSLPRVLHPRAAARARPEASGGACCDSVLPGCARAARGCRGARAGGGPPGLAIHTQASHSRSCQQHQNPVKGDAADRRVPSLDLEGCMALPAVCGQLECDKPRALSSTSAACNLFRSPASLCNATSAACRSPVDLGHIAATKHGTRFQPLFPGQLGASRGDTRLLDRLPSNGYQEGGREASLAPFLQRSCSSVLDLGEFLRLLCIYV